MGNFITEVSERFLRHNNQLFKWRKILVSEKTTNKIYIVSEKTENKIYIEEYFNVFNVFNVQYIPLNAEIESDFNQNYKYITHFLYNIYY